MIGRGSYAKVLMVEQRRTKRIYAMKVIKKELVNDDEVTQSKSFLFHLFVWGGGRVATIAAPYQAQRTTISGATGTPVLDGF